jgi:AraC-like DNA-binding protein
MKIAEKSPVIARHAGAVDPDAVALAAFVLDEFRAPTEGAMHTHRIGQLVHASAGVLIVSTPAGRWVAPPERAVWVPAEVPHAVTARSAHRLRTLYVRDAPPQLPSTCTVLAIDALVAHLLEAAAAAGTCAPHAPPSARLLQVLVDRVALLRQVALHLPYPTTPALIRVADELVADPKSPRTLLEWCRMGGLSERTAARRFQAETGMTYRQWRQQSRVLAALGALVAGASVTAVAFDVGYEDVSSFIAAFKTVTGETPQTYQKSHQAAPR